jgi:predicted regulator of amino acid metabolism with ACT domain
MLFKISEFVMTALPIYIKLADELKSMSMRLDSMGTTLCEEVDLSPANIAALQEIDRICQMQNAIADALSYSNPETGCRVSKLDNIRALVYPHVLQPE